MRTRSIGHACLEIETNGLRILTDPWWAGPAYTNQWYAWPTPQPAGVQERPVDYVYLSHGHEDHLHADTLKTLRPGATALVPEFLSGSMAPYLRDCLGFAQVIELRHGETVTLRRGLKATCYVNLTDSILVLEDGDRVLVNANDALHASPPAVIDHFCRLLKKRHPRIDQLYMGFSGASWFPNCIRVPGKNDRQVARAREELFTDNFLRVVDALSPKVASAFAASFVLVEAHNRWVNEVKLELPTPDEVYRKKRPTSGTKAHLLLPNDLVDGAEIVSGTCPKPTQAEFDKALGGVLREAAERADHLTPLTPDQLRDLVARLDTRVRANSARVGPQLSPFAVEIRLRDNPGVALRVEMERSGARASLGAPREPTATLELRAEILEAALRDDYGIESISIGYGAVATLDKSEHYNRILALFTLLSPRQGSWRAVAAELQRSPLRTAAALWAQRWPLAYAVGARLGVIPHAYELKHLDHETQQKPLREAA